MRPLILALLLLPALASAQESSGEGSYAPDPGAPPPLHFRADFKTAWAVTDGSGMIDHAALEGTFGPQIGDARPGGPPAISPLFGVTGGIAEEGRPSLRLWGGLELAFGLSEHLELAPAVGGGWMRTWKGDERVGPMFRATVALRVLGDDGFSISVEPVAFVLLPEPEGGFTPYTTHFALDMGIIKFGGRTP